MIAVVFTSCIEEELVINYGFDQCHSCKMSISQANYGAALKTAKGRVYKFDALECMMQEVTNNSFIDAEYFAVAFDKPKQLQAVEKLQFVVNKQYRSPMGAYLAAFENTNSCMAPNELSANVSMIKHEAYKSVENLERQKDSDVKAFNGNWAELKIYFSK